ncbi:MAG: tetratricopeptide repeat protein, partial [Myxococcota bacterium]
NYGLSLLFLRRREIEIPSGAKRLLYASFLLSTVLAVLPLHTALPSVSYALEVTGPSATYPRLRVGVPSDVARWILVVAAIAYAGCLLKVAVVLRRVASWRELAPAALLVATQALWFSIPTLVQSASADSANVLVLTAVWINVAHGIQYLWITSHYARRERSDVRLAPYLAKATLAGSLLNFVPALLLAPALFGTVPFDAGLAALIASVANLHHFILDGAIWKLRDGRVARVLLRTAPREDGVPLFTHSRSWLGPAILAVGVVGLAVNGFDTHQRRLLAQPGVDVATAHAALDRLAWIAREPPAAHVELGRELLQRGNHVGALKEFHRALELGPDARAWSGIGALHELSGRMAEALAAYEAALG